MSTESMLKLGCTAALAFVIATSSSTARADARAEPNIPGASAPSAAAASSQEAGAPTPAASGEPMVEPAAASEPGLPAPYAAWRGRGFGAPPAAPPDEPAPLERPLERARRSFEATAALAAFLPSCGAGSIDASSCLTVSPGSGVDMALLWRVGPLFAVGAEAALSGFAHSGQGALGRGGGSARFFGLSGRVYFADSGAWDPYVAVTLGVGTLALRSTGRDGVAGTRGWGARVAGGIDYVFGSRLRIGPSASFAHWLSYGSSSCSADSFCSYPSAYGRLLGFATLGLRVTALFGDAL